MDGCDVELEPSSSRPKLASLKTDKALRQRVAAALARRKLICNYRFGEPTTLVHEYYRYLVDEHALKPIGLGHMVLFALMTDRAQQLHPIRGFIDRLLSERKKITALLGERPELKALCAALKVSEPRAARPIGTPRRGSPEGLENRGSTPGFRRVATGDETDDNHYRYFSRF